MTEIEKHIEKKIPFAIETKEGEMIVIFPAEKRFATDKASVVMKDEQSFNNELGLVTADCKNFQSLRPTTK